MEDVVSMLLDVACLVNKVSNNMSGLRECLQ